jgi:hypothetical protein
MIDKYIYIFYVYIYIGKIKKYNLFILIEYFILNNYEITDRFSYKVLKK